MNILKKLVHVTIIVLLLPFILIGLVIELVKDGIEDGRYLFRTVMNWLGYM